MDNSRIEILKDGTWTTLKLEQANSIRYNVLINKIGSMSSREISHSNTFSLPYIDHNIQALEINIFNAKQLAKSLNAKYIAKYYIGDVLMQKGFLVINNTKNGFINVNFIDEALEIIEKWGSMTYYDFLNSDTINVPQDYKQVIDFMKEYSMTKTQVLQTIPTVGSRGYSIAKYPNSLNAIGDKFQKKADGSRGDNEFNPYQSRPIFNARALFDLAIESFGYTPLYDLSVDWDTIKSTHMIDKDLSQSQKGDNSTVTIEYPKVDSNSPFSIFSSTYTGTTLFNFIYPSTVQALYPNDLLNFPGLPDFRTLMNYFSGNLEKDYTSQDRCIFIPNKSNLTIGNYRWKISPMGAVVYEAKVFAIWKNQISGEDVILQELMVDFDSSETHQSFTEFSVKKSQLANKPVGTGDIAGVFAITVGVFGGSPTSPPIRDLVFSETSLPKGIVSYDEFDQYEGEIINLTHAAPRVTIKELLAAIMQKEGILMSFDNNNKIVKLFTYGSYATRKKEGKFSDWSTYHRRDSSSIYDTDYGSEYAKLNEVGLQSPYKGNTYFFPLENQGELSKYKDFAQNLSTKFKDVEGVTLIGNSNTPYYEYKNTGLGLVELGVPLGQLTQVRADGSIQGTFLGLESVYNVNYLNLPRGTKQWYQIIDEAVRCESIFLLPIEVVRNFDPSEPIYVETLGGFYIVEEIQEYIDPQTPVSVKLIKLSIVGEDYPPDPVLDPDFNQDFKKGDFFRL